MNSPRVTALGTRRTGVLARFAQRAPNLRVAARGGVRHQLPGRVLGTRINDSSISTGMTTQRIAASSVVSSAWTKTSRDARDRLSAVYTTGRPAVFQRPGLSAAPLPSKAVETRLALQMRQTVIRRRPRAPVDPIRVPLRVHPVPCWSSPGGSCRREPSRDVSATHEHESRFRERRSRAP